MPARPRACPPVSRPRAWGNQGGICESICRWRPRAPARGARRRGFHDVVKGPPTRPGARGEESETRVSLGTASRRAPHTPGAETCGSALAGHFGTPRPQLARNPHRGKENRPGGRRRNTQKPAISGKAPRPFKRARLGSFGKSGRVQPVPAWQGPPPWAYSGRSSPSCLYRRRASAPSTSSNVPQANHQFNWWWS